jgi:hypothetical protein
MPSVLNASSKANTLAQVSDMVGGLNRRVAQSMLPPNKAWRLHNVRLGRPGEFAVRPGWETFTDSSFGSNRIQGARRVYLSGVSPATIVAYGGDLYTQPDNGSAATSRYSGLDATNAIDLANDYQIAAAFDGVNIPVYSANTTDWYQMGIDAPASAPTLAQSAGGTLTNGTTYEVSYAYQNAAIGQPPGNESAAAQITMGGAGRKITATVAASTDGQVDTIVLYARDVTASESQRRLYTTVANPGVGTVDIDITAEAWEDNAEAQTANDVAPAGLVSALPWKNRWWGFSGRRVTFSELYQSLGWNPLYYIELPFTQGDEIAAIVPLGDSLIVFGHTPTQVFLIVGQTSLDFEVRPAFGAQGGALGFRACTVIEGGILHACREGVYLFDGAQDRLLTFDIETDWRSMVSEMSSDELSRVAVVRHLRDKEVRIGGINIPIYGEPGEWVMDLTRSGGRNGPAWSTTDRAVGGYLQWDGDGETTGLSGRLQSWGLSVGHLYTESEGTTADGADMTAHYEGPVFTSGYFGTRFTNLYGEYEPNGGTFAIEVAVDSLSVTTLTIDIGAGLARYGSATYGVSRYGGRGRKFFSFDLPLSAEGKSINIVATYTGQFAFKWFTYGIDMVREPRIRGTFNG